ncbi:hypothetical protein LAZ67_X003051 [Cordylochernes scorpioides]|uniref:Reverse transcriptase domain-containing protein n=1 Tax=Cordylochernes scorpioides TaxID=51811 RepID=A0ABY6LUV9_9ARAC|nr:hypothetical protein LAZ67_X003051 [Cordylochernes scorpioides]
MKNFVKAMDRNASGFGYLKQKCSSISDAKIKEGIFVGPQIRELLQDANFQNIFNELKQQHGIPLETRNWADMVENEMDNFEPCKKRKRSPPSERVRQPQPGPSRQTEPTRDNTAPRQPSPSRNIIEQIEMVYLEYSPEFTPVDYIKALENELGKSCVVQLGKASRQVLVGLEWPEMEEKTIEDGLMIRGALLKALPYQKKAEKNNHQRASKHLPKKIVVTAKGGSALAYLEYSFRCSKWQRMGHKRMNCPRIIREANTIQPSSLKSSVKPAHAPNITSAASPPAAIKHPAPVAAPAQTFSTPPTQEAKAPETEPTTRTPETSIQTDLNISIVGSTALFQLNTLLERLPRFPFEDITLLGLKKEEVKEAIVSLSHLRLLMNKISAEQKLALFLLCEQLIKGLGDSKSTLYKPLADIKSWTRSAQELPPWAIAAAAINEDPWVLGDLIISEESASDIAFGSVEALGELLDRANLVDAAAIFDAAHLPTRISSCGSRVDASRLDRVLLPSRLSNRVTRYWSLYYKNSDHRAVLLQIGEAPEPRPPCIAIMLRSRLVVGTVETLLNEAFGNIEDMQNAEIWRRWGQIKAHLASAIKSLHDLHNNDDDYISRARKYVQIKLKYVSINLDYPSLPDLERALRLRCRGTSSTTFYDSADRVITGPAVRDLAFANLNDPLHRYGIGEEEIVTAIGCLPTGKAAGWDDFPCEFFRGFEDFFASALRRVFEAFQLCGALPSSMRRSEMSLIAKPHGGLGLAGLRPLSLPTTDYRVLSGVLYWRLRPHLRDIVPECQSYAVPEETPLAVVATDLESAFDTLDRGFLMSVLLSVGLPPVFVGWVFLLYAGAEATARIEGIGRTPLLYMLNGVRQGCAASAAFFTISTGPLLLRLEQLLGRDNVLAYADDIVLLIREDGQLEVVKKIFEDFRRASGIRVNSGKSQGLWCGRWRNRTDFPLDISWNREKINSLAALRGGRNAHSWLAKSGMWLSPASTPGTWLPLRRRRSLHLFEAAAEILELNHRILQPAFLQALRVVGDCRFLRPPELLSPTRWLGWGIGELSGPPPNITIAMRGALADAASLGSFCSRLVTQNARGRHRRLTNRTARRMLERPRLAALPITQLLGRWLPHVSIPISISRSSLRRCTFLGHNSDVAVRLALHALPHPAHPSSARESCITCGSGDLSLAHRYWSCSLIRPVIVEAFTIIQRPPDLQAWIFWHDLEDDALAIMASAKTPGETKKTPSSQTNGLQAHIKIIENGQVFAVKTLKYSEMTESHSELTNGKDANTKPAADGGHANFCRNWADCPEQEDQLIERQEVIFTKVGGSKKRLHDPDHVKSGTKKGCVQAPGMPLNSSRPRASLRPSKVHECQTTRQKQATFRARSAAGQAEECYSRKILPGVNLYDNNKAKEDEYLYWCLPIGVYLEFCADFTQEQYFRALEAKLGKGTIYQLTKMEGHILAGLSSMPLADKLIEEGLDIEDATLRAFPLRKRAERIVLGNVLFFLEDARLVAALRPYGQVTFIIQKMMQLEDSSWADARREAFIALRDGVKISHIPARLDVKSKGVVTHFYVTYGIKCSLCHKQGHKRAISLRKTGLQEDKLVLPVEAPAARTQGWTNPTRQKQATFRVRSAAGQADQCVYLESCPDFTQEQYFRALEANLGKGTVYQLTKMEGQILVGLSSVQQADKAVEDGLEIENALLRATPLKKRAERIVIGNVPFFVENLDLLAAQRPYGQITSIVQKMMELGESYWADARPEAFITLRDGVKLSHIPFRLEIKSKGVTSHVYVTYGIKCSLCYKHGHKRDNCPRKTGVQEANLLLHVDPPAGSNNAGGRQLSSSNAMPAPVPTPAAGSSLTAAPIPDVSPEPPAAPPTPAASPAPPAAPASAPETLPTTSVDPVPPTSKQSRSAARKTQKKSNVTRTQLNELLERIPSNILDKSGLEGLEREEVLDALASVPDLKSMKNKIGNEERPMSFRLSSINARGLAAREKSIELCHFLRQHRVDVAFIQETNASSLDAIQHLCLGYSAVIVPPAALRDSGLVCLFAPGVAVLRQRVLWPGNIFIVSIDVRDQEVRVINCHPTHIPRERLEQLETITAVAIQEDAWVMGDLNIDNQSTSDTASGSVEALTELMEQRALVDVATLFDPAHLPTRMASCRRRIDTAHLDRILLPSRLLERVTIEALWIRWSKIKAELLAEVRSLHVSSVAEGDHISRAGRFLHARLEAASSAADYPSLPYLRRFARESSDPIAAAEFIRGTTTPLTLEENDLLIRSVITGAEIAAAIRRLPLGRAPGWDDLHCEFLIAYEDFFVEALRRVFEASKLRGALPSSIRRSTICLVPNSNGGPGLSACRPISLPTADYRVLSNILLQRLRPQFPVLVPRCQTYAVPGRPPSWYVSRIADEIHMATRNGSELAVISTDLESAFDTLDRSFLVSLMVSLRLLPAFIEWFLILYAGADAAVRAGGLHTRPFHLLNGPCHRARGSNESEYIYLIPLYCEEWEARRVILDEKFRARRSKDANVYLSRDDTQYLATLPTYESMLCFCGRPRSSFLYK